MPRERREGLRLFLWIALAMVLHYVAMVVGQVLTSVVFVVQDMNSGILTYNAVGEIFYNGEAVLESEAYFLRYGYETSGYGTILAVPLIILVLFFLSKKQRQPLKVMVPANRFPLVPCLLALVIGFMVYFPVSYIINYSALQDLSPENQETIQMIFQQTPYWVLFLSTAVCAPLIEELTFRGFIYSQIDNILKKRIGEIEDKYGKIKDHMSEVEDGELRQQAIEERLQTLRQRSHIYVIAIQALLFGAFHMNLQQFLYASALGVLFGIMRHYTKSVWPGVMAHIGFNAFSVGLYGLLQHEEWGVTKWLLGMNDIVLLLVTLVLFAVSLFAFEKVVKKPQENHGKTSQNP